MWGKEYVCAIQGGIPNAMQVTGLALIMRRTDMGFSLSIYKTLQWQRKNPNNQMALDEQTLADSGKEKLF